MNSGVILLVIAIALVSMAIIPSVDADSNGRLTIKSSQKSVTVGEPLSFTGKLTDRNGYAISNAQIIIWENDGGKNSHVATTRTDARGEYKVTVTAEYWDGIGNSVEIFAYSGTGSIKSVTRTINIDKPNPYQTEPQTKQYVQPTQTTKKLVPMLQLTVEKSETHGYAKVFPNLKSPSRSLLSNMVNVYQNDNFIKKIPTNQWSSVHVDVSNAGLMKIISPEFTVGNIVYGSVGITKTYDFKSMFDSPSKSTTQTNTHVIQSQNSLITIYKQGSSDVLSLQTKAIDELNSGLKNTELILSGLNFENSEARQKVDSAWNAHWYSKTHIEKAKEKFDQSKSYFENSAYRTTYSTLVNIQDHSYNAKDQLYSILSLIKDAKAIEIEFQKKQQQCILFWCDEIQMYEYLEPKFQSLEIDLNQLETILNNVENEKSKVKDLLYENEIKERDIKIQQIQVQKEKELRDLKRQADLENQRLEEQKERELREQQYQAEQERLRLEEEKRQQEAEYKVELERQKQSTLQILASKNPLLKKIMTGKVTFWVEPIPPYAGTGVRESVQKMLDAFESWEGVSRIYSEGAADIKITWIRDFNPTVGGQYWQSYIQVGLGSTGCYGDWQPFTSHTVRQILWHELGHAMGYGHSKDPKNIMRASGPHYFDKEYENDIFLEEGHFSWLAFCNGGQYTFQLKSNNQNSGFEFYVITPETNAKDFITKNEGKHFPDCREKGEWRTYTKTCSLQKGSYLLIHNPRDDGNAINVDVITQYTGSKQAYDMVWDPDVLKESSQYLHYLSSLK